MVNKIMSFGVNNANSPLFVPPPNFTRIVIPRDIPISEAHANGQAVSRLSTPQDFFSWRDVVSVEPSTLEAYNAEYCANLADLTKMTIRYNRGNGQYYRTLYRSLNGTSSTTQRISQETYRQNGINRDSGILFPALNQGQCGSCYTFGTTECVSNRMVISTFGQTRQQLSPWYVLNKCLSGGDLSVNQFCNGGDISSTLKAIETSNGVATLSNSPYPNITNCTNATTCSNPNGTIQLGQQNCNTTSALYRSYRAHWECTKRVADAMEANNFNLKTIPGTVVQATPQDPTTTGYWMLGLPSDELADNMSKIMAHLYNEGPVALGFSVYTDFFNYNTNNPYAIYTATPGTKTIDGGHCVLLVGYGTAADGTLYFELLNSWNSSWGDNGFFYFVRGINYCGIESNAMGNLVDSNPLTQPPVLPYPTPTVPTCGSSTSFPSQSNFPLYPSLPSSRSMNVIPNASVTPHLMQNFFLPPSSSTSISSDLLPVTPIITAPASSFIWWLVILLIIFFLIIFIIIIAYFQVETYVQNY